MARRLMRALDRATLATAQRPSWGNGAGNGGDAAGWPYPSLVLVALDLDASPLLLLSDLADHSRNIAEDPRAGLLFDGTVGMASPLAGARVSVLGRLTRTNDLRHRARFLARHPEAEFYARFKDFGLYRMAVERAHLVAGFGRIHWIDGDELLLPEVPPALAEAEAGLLAAMNADHAAAIQRCATLRSGSPDAVADEGGRWVMTGIDPDGCDLRCAGAVARFDFAEFDFDRPLDDPESARAALEEVVQRCSTPKP